MEFFKKHTGIECIEYKEALEEALCFGWIDSLIKKVDARRYLRKFTPRTNPAKWSELNKKLVVELINQERMTEAGLRKIESYLKTGKVEWKTTEKKETRKETGIPGFISNEFKKNEPAYTNFINLAPTYQRHYLMWITQPKRKETICKRLKDAVGLLKENKKLGLK